MSPRAPDRCRFRVLIRGFTVAALLVPFATASGAQTVRVTSGEHAGHTRIVLQSRTPLDWSLSPEGRTRQLHVAATTLEFDPAEVFRLIPRTRLADLRRIEGGLELRLDCDCEIRTEMPSPGIVVLDIHDAAESPAPAEQPAPAPVPQPPAPRPVLPSPPRARALALAPPPPFAGDPARAAGAELARRMRAQAQDDRDDAPTPADPPAIADPVPLMEILARQMSQAIAQGLLSAALAQRALVLPGAEPPLADPDLANLQISRATDPRRPPPEPEAVNDTCLGVDVLAFPLSEEESRFRDRHAALMRELYGEFDHPDRAHHESLARLYLEHGFGAEARLVIENAPAQVAGRDLLLGLGDVLEDRYSNARLRLAERIECGGAASMFAALAGASPAAIRPRGGEIARAYHETAPPLRLALGEALVRRLLEAEAREAARMVADTLRRTSDPPPPAMPLIDALLDAARGEVDRAAARLDYSGRSDSAALVMRLGLALDRGERVGERLLADAEAVAAAERTTETGITLMALLVRLHNAAERPAEAFALLDRLERWLPATAANAMLLDELRGATWTEAIAAAEDSIFLQIVFERDDWRHDTLAGPTRRALAERLLDFGLTDPAAELTRGLTGDGARHLRARILLITGDPAGAMAELAGLEDDAAQHLRARAERQLGAPEEAPPGGETRPSGADTDTEPASGRGGEDILQRSTALLSESAQLRAMLDDLLEGER